MKLLNKKIGSLILFINSFNKISLCKFPLITRKFSSEIKINETLKKIKLHEFMVTRFGVINCKLAIPVKVIPLNPIDYPEMNKLFIHLIVPNDINENSLVKNLVYCKISQHTDENVVNVISLNKLKENIVNLITCLIEIPIKYDIKLYMSSNNSASIEGLHGAVIEVNTESGDCNLKSINSKEIKIFSQTGNIICQKNLKGNVSITTGGSGNIVCHQLQGKDINLSTISGVISASAVYSERCTTKSQNGNINLGNVHCWSIIENETGDINVVTLDGSLKATSESGNISIHVMQHQEVNLLSKKGNILIILSDDLATNFELHGRSVVMDDKLKLIENLSERQGKILGVFKEKNSKFIKAYSPDGIITIKAQEWFASLNLK